MRSKLWTAVQVAAGLAASLGLGWLAIRGLNWGEVQNSLGGASVPLVLLAVVVFNLASLVRAIRWRILFIDEDITVWRLFIIQNEGVGINNVAPIRVASEATQLGVLRTKDGIDGAKALATLGMERVVDVIASSAILGVAFFFIDELKNFSIYVWGAVGFAVVSVVAVRLVTWSGQAMTFMRRFKFLVAFADAVRILEQERLRLLASTILSLGYWLMIGVTAWFIAVAMKLPISPMTATLVILGTTFFATAIPAAPGAIGTFEFGIVYVLSFFNVGKEESFGFAVMAHAVIFLPPTIIAAICLPREGLFSMQRVRSLASRLSGVGGGTSA